MPKTTLAKATWRNRRFGILDPVGNFVMFCEPADALPLSAEVECQTQNVALLEYDFACNREFCGMTGKVDTGAT